MPRLLGDVAARLTPDDASWPVVFLHLVTESARAGSRLLDGLRTAAEAGQALAKEANAGSRLPTVLDQLLRQPALTAPTLARSLAITPQAALRLLARLGAAGLVREITRRTRFQLVELIVGRTTRVVLAAAHRDHNPRHNRARNLEALCQRCHLQHDRLQHRWQRWLTHRRRYAIGDLFLGFYVDLCQRAAATGAAAAVWRSG